MDTQTHGPQKQKCWPQVKPCDVFVLREQYINIRWQKFSFDNDCNNNKKSIKILNTANHFKLVTDEKRVCICVEWSK